MQYNPNQNNDLIKIKEDIRSDLMIEIALTKRELVLLEKLKIACETLFKLCITGSTSLDFEIYNTLRKIKYFENPNFLDDK